MTDEKTRALVQAAEMHQEKKQVPQCDEPDCGCADSLCAWCGDEWPCLPRRLADALSALTVPDGDAVVERIRAKLDQIPDLDAVALDKTDVRVLLARIAVPDGDARERLLGVLAKHGHVEWDDLDVATVADAILAAIPIPSRDIAGEIEAEIEESVAHGGVLRGLRRAAEIARGS